MISIRFEWHENSDGEKPSGREVQWPAVPRAGDTVEVDDETDGEVEYVLWLLDGSAVVWLK